MPFSSKLRVRVRIRIRVRIRYSVRLVSGYVQVFLLASVAIEWDPLHIAEVTVLRQL